MSHFGKALGSRSRGRSVSRSRHTAWKMSAASSYRPSLMGIEKIRFLYLSTRAAQAFSSPCRHSATRRSSGQEARLSRCIFAATVTGFRLFPCLWFRCVGKAGRHSTVCNDPALQDENCRPEPSRRPEHSAWQEKRRQVFGDELLNSIIKPLPLLVVQRDHLLLHQLINFSLPIAGGLRFSEMPQMSAPARKPYIHLRIGIRITAAQAHDGCFVSKTLEYAIEHRAKIERHNMNLHAQMR